jgi:hypothetical protein
VGDDDITARAFLFDPQQMQWAETTPMNARRATANIVPLPDGRVLHVGGIGPAPQCCNSTATADVFDPRTGMWLLAPDLPPLKTDAGWKDYDDAGNAVNPGSRWQACAGVVDGQAIVAGGATFWDGGFTIRRSAVAYSATGNSWIEIAPMLEHRAGCRATVLDGGALLVVGSGFFDSWWSKTSEQLAGGAWSDAGDFSDGHVSTFGGAALPLGDGALVVAGSAKLMPGRTLVADGEAFVYR